MFRSQEEILQNEESLHSRQKKRMWLRDRKVEKQRKTERLRENYCNEQDMLTVTLLYVMSDESMPHCHGAKMI